MRTTFALAAFFLAALLSGCGTSVERAVFGDGADGFAKKTLHAHVLASVANDETSTSFAMSNFDRAAGVGDAERAYRRVSLLILVDEGRPPLFGMVGMRGALALVPDGMPMLRKGDIVEVRTTSLYDGLKGFVRTGEGAAVVKVHCMGGPNLAMVSK